MSDVQVTMAHVRQAGYCMGACRKWFPDNGLSWSEFIDHGYPASVLEATGDGLALAVVRIAREGADG